MNGKLSEEQQMLQDTLRRFFANCSEETVWAELAELGVIGSLFTESIGGYGGQGTDIAVVFEELGRSAVQCPLIDNALLPGLLLAAANQDISALISGEQRLAFAHSETGSRYELDWIETAVNNDQISGHKTVVIGADSAQSILVSAKPNQNDERMSLWSVPTNTTNLMMNQYTVMQGGQAADLTFENTPATLVLDDAFSAIKAAMASATLAQCALTLGAMESAVNLTRDYMSTRKQFGRPIGSFQALAHRLVDLMVELEQSRSAVNMAADHLNAEPRLRDLHISAAKNLIGRAGRLVAEETIQMHGGMGITEEYALGRYAKRIVMADHCFGDTDYHMEQFIALNR